MRIRSRPDGTDVEAFWSTCGCAVGNPRFALSGRCWSNGQGTGGGQKYSGFCGSLDNISRVEVPLMGGVVQ